MTKSKKITIILCSILFAFVGFFGFILANKNDSVVKADSVDTNYQFSTSGLYIPYSIFSSENNTSVDTSSPAGYNGFVKIRFFFGYADNGVSRSTFYTSFNTNNEFLPSSPGNNIYIRYDSSANSALANYVNFSPYSGGNWPERYGYMITDQQFYPYTYNLSSSDFNYNIVSCRIYSTKDGFWGKSNLGQYFFVFTDINGNSLTVVFTCYNGRLRDNMMLENRTYYYTSSFNDNQYFNAGYDNGYDSGLVAGSNEGYSNGYDVGYNSGFSDGFNDGILNANDYTFLGLIGATIDAPINAFTSFFDFELLGVNLKDFFFAILTFALVIVIVRFALAR